MHCKAIHEHQSAVGKHTEDSTVSAPAVFSLLPLERFANHLVKGYRSCKTQTPISAQGALSRGSGMQSILIALYRNAFHTLKTLRVPCNHSALYRY